MPEGHIDSKKSLLAKIVISRQRKLLDPEAANDQFGDIFGLDCCDGLFISVRGGIAGVFFMAVLSFMW